jgi:hypothetical protein
VSAAYDAQYLPRLLLFTHTAPLFRPSRSTATASSPAERRRSPVHADAAVVVPPPLVGAGLVKMYFPVLTVQARRSKTCMLCSCTLTQNHIPLLKEVSDQHELGIFM